jgi:hypothetical protein
MLTKKYKIAVLDDYQNVALESAGWSVLCDRADIPVLPGFMGGRNILRMKVRTRPCPLDRFKNIISKLATKTVALGIRFDLLNRALRGGWTT